MAFWVVWLCCALITPAFAEEGHDGHDDHAEDHADGHAEEESGADIEISLAQQKVAGIVVEVLGVAPLVAEIAAPGEVKLNAYLTHKVTPRITAQAMQRHVRLGDHVVQDQVLITLSSVEMSVAQGTLQVAEREWQRVRKLGRETVSDRRYTEARVARDQARARAQAYGMTSSQIDALATGQTSTRADGTFQLLAPRAGTVISDAFIEGEFVEPGRVLFEISDETQVWVEASLTPREAMSVKVGATARIRVGDTWHQGRVVQVHHVLDEVTRTLAVRIEVPNPDEHLHPGLFVDVRIGGGGVVDALSVPEEVVLRSADGDWVVFVEHEPGRFEPVEVEVKRTIAGRAVIEGVAVGTRVVTQGAFFVQSEMAKGGFDPHNH
ncbi:MAG: efflux RND transporter periplasmic adaptor subunit [Gammaproteobacteria bacterium]|nr:efflux RND transporter periplasmic adaptor subunit [Gammaproteobacteria bacterium]